MGPLTGRVRRGGSVATTAVGQRIVTTGRRLNVATAWASAFAQFLRLLGCQSFLSDYASLIRPTNMEEWEYARRAVPKNSSWRECGIMV